MHLLRRHKAADPIKVIEDRFTSASFRKEYEAALAEAVTPIFEGIVLAGITSARELMKPRTAKKAGKGAAAAGGAAEAADVSIDLEALAADVIRAYVPTFTKSISETTYEHLANAVIRARESGGGVFEVLNTAEAMFGVERATSIAVTETTRLFGMASQATYKALGAERWEWQTVRDAFVCPICEGQNGDVHDIDEAFGPAHPRCRCFPKPAEYDAAEAA